MLGLLMRYDRYFIENNHEQDVDLMFFNVLQPKTVTSVITD